MNRDKALSLVMRCRLRLSANPGKANEVRVGVEVLQVVPGLSMVQVSHAPHMTLSMFTHYADLSCILAMQYVAYIAVYTYYVY